MVSQKPFAETAVVGPEQIGLGWLLDQYWDETLYLALANSRNVLVELSDGKVTFPMMPTPAHQQVTGNLYAALWEYGRTGNRGRAYMAPMPIRLWPGKFREPDVVFYRTEHLDRVGEQYGEAPGLATEVISPSTRALDVGIQREGTPRPAFRSTGWWTRKPEPSASTS